MHVDLCVTPGVAFAPGCVRLGHGGGYYDRWLAGAPDCLRIGLAFECQIVPALPQEPHDIVLHKVITESRVLSCAAELPRTQRGL